MRRRYALPGYLAGALAARTGDEMSGPALLLAGLAVTGSVRQGSTLLTGLTISAAVGGPLLGALLDRSARPGRLLAVTLAGYAAGLALVLTLLDPVPIPLVVALAVAVGLLNPAVAGGWTSQLPAVTTFTGLPRANAFDAMTFSAASLAGPALAGLLASTASATTAVLVATALVALAVPAACALPTTTRPATARARARLITESTSGLRAITASRSLLRATTVSVVSHLAVGMFVVCCPVLGARWFGDPGRGAWLLTAVAAAGLVTNALLARRSPALRPDTVILLSTVVLAAAMATAALPGAGWVVAAALLAGLGEGPQLTALFAIRHRDAPEQVRARVFTTGASLKITAMATGTAIAGVLAAASPLVCLLTAAAVQVSAATLFWLLGSGASNAARRASAEV